MTSSNQPDGPPAAGLFGRGGPEGDAADPVMSDETEALPRVSAEAPARRYTIVHRFTQTSGQAAAYLAIDEALGRRVVLKRYRGGWSGGELREGEALARVVSPHVARCFDVTWIEGAPHLVIEFIPGRNLAEIRRDGPMDLNRVIDVLCALAEAVAAVHARGLIHRDIKPANVILHDDGTPRLVDFGLAAAFGSPQLAAAAGSPAYMAPEQSTPGLEDVGPWTDVYGLGAVLYELLTGRPPHSSGGKKQGDAPAPPRSIDPTIPEAVEATCLKALSRAPRLRHSTALDFGLDLDRARRGAGRRVTARRRWLAAGLGAVLVAGIIAGAWPRANKPLAQAPAAPPPEIVNQRPSAGSPVMTVELFRRVGGNHAEPIAKMPGARAEKFAPKLGDVVRLTIESPQPRHIRLAALNPDGTVVACPTASDRGEAMSRVEFPEADGHFFSLTDGVGLQAFLMVGLENPPPPFEAWLNQMPGGLGWSPQTWEGRWMYDEPALLASTFRPRGPVVGLSTDPPLLKNLCDRLREVPGVVSVQAVAFDVKPAL